MEWIVNHLLLSFAGVGLLTFVIGWLTDHYLKPWVHAKPSRVEWAKELSIVARDVTAEVCKMFPDAKWDDIVAKIVYEITDRLEVLPKSAGKLKAVRSSAIGELVALKGLPKKKA